MSNQFGSKKEKKDKKVFPRTIPEEVLKAWNLMRRRNDAVKLCEDLNFSRPVIDRALNYGYVKAKDLTNLITNWYVKRANEEKESAKELTDMASELEGANNEKA